MRGYMCPWFWYDLSGNLNHIIKSQKICFSTFYLGFVSYMVNQEILSIRAKLREMDNQSKLKGEAYPELTLEREALVRRLCELQYASSPLWQERVRKNPDFWKTFSPGRIRWEILIKAYLLTRRKYQVAVAQLSLTQIRFALRTLVESIG